MRRSILLGIVGLLTMFGLASLVGSPVTLAQPKNNPRDAIEVAPGGPLHEAFAQPFEAKPGPGPMVPKEPPPLIPEEPPEQRPEGDNVQWIPGYWAYDAQKQDFMWVSGVYRVPPQDRTFVPGYWEHTADGWRWVNGFWSGANQQLPYTPEPPAPLDNGPTMPQPDDNSVYIPGVWVFRDGRFIWRPGYYAPAQLGRVWSPPRYYWTPSGYVFTDGYWDVPFEDRGLIFAPVYFRRPLWYDTGWRYRPSLVVGFNPFFDSAFVYGGGFYFGNYYDPFYARLGFHPWYHGRGRYDPVFTHHGWSNHRNNPNWVTGAQQTYAARSAGRAAAPVVATTPLNRVTNVKVVNSTPTQIKTQQTFVQQTRQVAVNRQQADAAFVSKGGNVRTFEGRSLNVLPSEKAVTIEPRSTTSPRITTPSIDSRSNATPKVEPKGTTSPPVPRTTTPAPKVEPKATTPTPAPRVNTTPPPSAPRVNPTPPPAAPRVNPTPPPARKVDAPAPTPKVTSQPKVTPQPAPRAAQPRATAPRIQTPSRPQVSSSPRVNNPPARTVAPARPATTGRKR